MLTAFPLSLERIRGLDVCADEAGVPTWVMAPLLRYARDAGQLACSSLHRRHGIHVPPLRRAIHAGEDFVHLMTGLRRLDDSIERLHLVAGDRIGHGLALGVEPRAWATRAGRIAMPEEDRLFDLVWEWSWRSRDGVALSTDRHLRLEREIADRSCNVLGALFSPRQLDQLVQDLHDEGMLRAVGFPSGPVPLVDAQDERRALMKRFLTDPDVFKRGRKSVWIDPRNEGEPLDELQRALRRKVGARGLVIEVNPSSNLLIAQLAHFGEHPLWRLRPHGAGDGQSPLAVTIGSDDPLPFATHLRQEYQLVHDAIVLEGASTEQADAWIEGVRSASLNARFTLPWSGRPLTDIIHAESARIPFMP